MNLLRIISSMDPSFGGPSQGIRNSIPELEKIGVHNEVVCLDDADAPFLKKDGFPVHAIGTGKSPWSYNRELIPWLEKNLHRFDAVIVHGLWLYPTYAAAKVFIQYKRKNKGRTVPRLYIMPHGMLDPYFQKAEGRKLKAIRNWFYWKLIEARVINGADGLFFTCEEELRLAKATFNPYHPKKELNIGYGTVKPPAYTNQMKDAFSEKCTVANDKPYLLFLSRIHPKKGVDILVKAYLKLKGQQKHLPKLIIAGPGIDTSYGEEISRLCNGDEDILFPGMLTGDAKLGAFYGCEALILPSHQENFGIAVAEALACSRPVLISNKVNIWREIEAHNAGMVDDDTEQGVTRLLTRWTQLTDQQKLDMRESAKTAFEKEFSIERSAARIKTIITS